MRYAKLKKFKNNECQDQILKTIFFGFFVTISKEDQIIFGSPAHYSYALDNKYAYYAISHHSESGPVSMTHFICLCARV